MNISRKIPVAMATFGACLLLGAELPVLAAAPGNQQASAASSPEMAGPTVPAAKPGVYSQTKLRADRYRVTVKGHVFTTQDAIEKYLLYRAAELTLNEHAGWFALMQTRAKGDSAPVPKPDPDGLRYSFRMKYWQPVWRYKLAAAKNWSTWSPFSGSAFFANDKDPKTISAYEVSAEVVLHKGRMDDTDPLAFEPGAVADFLVNQVQPPE